MDNNWTLCKTYCDSWCCLSSWASYILQRNLKTFLPFMCAASNQQGLVFEVSVNVDLGKNIKNYCKMYYNKGLYVLHLMQLHLLYWLFSAATQCRALHLKLSFIHTPLQCSYVTDISSIYCNSMQCTALQVKIDAVSQCSSWCRDGNTSTATYHNTDAVQYEQSFRIKCIFISITVQ